MRADHGGVDNSIVKHTGEFGQDKRTFTPSWHPEHGMSTVPTENIVIFSCWPYWPIRSLRYILSNFMRIRALGFIDYTFWLQLFPWCFKRKCCFLKCHIICKFVSWPIWSRVSLSRSTASSTCKLAILNYADWIYFENKSCISDNKHDWTDCNHDQEMKGKIVSNRGESQRRMLNFLLRKHAKNLKALN